MYLRNFYMQTNPNVNGLREKVKDWFQAHILFDLPGNNFSDIV